MNDENRIPPIALEDVQYLGQVLFRAVELLREYGSCDPYSGQPYDEVTEFLRSVGVSPKP